MKSVIFITDYKGYFGSKYHASPYRSGMDRKLLSGFMADKGFESFFARPVREELEKYDLSSAVIVFGSHQDMGLHYKRFLEDLAVALEAAGYKVCPSSILIRAHENKTFLEMMRNFAGSPSFRQIRSWWYGSFEEFKAAADGLPYPVLIKRHDGSMSRGVFLARDRSEALRVAGRIMRTPGPAMKIRDTVRWLRHKNYVRESWKRRKIAVQEFIAGLKNDYKVLVFGTRYYVLYRRVREGDFRASGQGLLEYRRELPQGLLDFAMDCFMTFSAPQASFDIGFDGSEFYLFEAQYVCFGTYTIENSPFHFTKTEGGWSCIEERSCLEAVYAESLAWFIKK
jgi:glutathione synthase/RimK-type ligase-like ATP-grasp enzyme